MGKGDIKTRKGKIAKGTYGVTRPRKNNKSISNEAIEKPKKKKAATRKRAVAKKEK